MKKPRLPYHLHWQTKKDHWCLDMVMPAPYHTTAVFPQTSDVLQRVYPAVLATECFNDDHLPFIQEVKATEVGHLLEHILLEQLCEDKLAAGCTYAEFVGETSWNWKKELPGTFHITVQRDLGFASNFRQALKNSLQVFNKVITSTAQPMIAAAPVCAFGKGGRTSNRELILPG